MYKIGFTSIQKIETLKQDWLSLQNGKDMTFFQRYDWYRMLAEKNKNIHNSHFDIAFATVHNGEKVTLIAPLWIIRKTFSKHNKKGVYVFGRRQWADYLNFIYDEFDSKAVKFLFEQIKKNYCVSKFILDDIPSNSALSYFIEENYRSETNHKTNCVHLNIPDTSENYMRMLSKSSRQNIRTAQNRIEKDGIKLVFNFDDKDVNLDEFNRCRNIRVLKKEEKYKRSLFSNIKLFVSQTILRRQEFSFAPYNPWNDANDIHFITAKTGNDDLCAAFCYGMDKQHRRIVLMAVSTNPDYYKYSPGVLALYNYIQHQIATGEIDILDFTRGDEKYKYSLGGTDHFNISYCFHL